ncbi:MAG: hypothetical protein M3Z98_06730 [Candidatus Dormibacteraeota bacterium]|nr:hypothetical protein [Candidatus Dormibacteraeota bacterium]
MGGFFSRRRVWVPILAIWLGFGIVLGVFVANTALNRFGPLAAKAALQQTGTTAPADLPGDFPIYPGGQVVMAYTSPAVAGTKGIFIETDDAVGTVFAYYNSALKQYPWHVNVSFSYPLHEISCQHVSSPVLSCSLTVDRGRSGKTMVGFQWAPLRVKPR